MKKDPPQKNTKNENKTRKHSRTVPAEEAAADGVTFDCDLANIEPRHRRSCKYLEQVVRNKRRLNYTTLAIICVNLRKPSPLILLLFFFFFYRKYK